jgi:hypothetical protein
MRAPTQHIILMPWTRKSRHSVLLQILTTSPLLSLSMGSRRRCLARISTRSFSRQEGLRVPFSSLAWLLTITRAFGRAGLALWMVWTSRDDNATEQAGTGVSMWKNDPIEGSCGAPRWKWIWKETCEADYLSEIFLAH